MIDAIVAAAALLLLGAGATKVADPTRTAGALAHLGWPASPTLVRVGAVVEAALGATTLVVGGRVAAAGVAVSYMGFAVFVAAALRSGRPVGTCGCFGRADTPPRPAHVVVDVLFAVVAGVGAVVGIDALVDTGGITVAAAVVVAGAGYLVLTRGSLRSGVSAAGTSA